MQGKEMVSGKPVYICVVASVPDHGRGRLGRVRCDKDVAEFGLDAYRRIMVGERGLKFVPGEARDIGVDDQVVVQVKGVRSSRSVVAWAPLSEYEAGIIELHKKRSQTDDAVAAVSSPEKHRKFLHGATRHPRRCMAVGGITAFV